jgi:hypothetical protein
MTLQTTSTRYCVGENWKPIAGFEGAYEVSDLGNVRSLPRVTTHGRTWKGRVLKPGLNKDGHLRVVLAAGPTKRQVFVHALVLETFVGPRPTKAHDGCHSNGIAGDNRVENLRWDTKRNNRLDDVKHGKNVQANRTHCPRGHELADWNNHTWYALRGRRTCKSCCNARSHARNTGTAFDPAKADDYYRKHMLEKEED